MSVLALAQFVSPEVCDGAAAGIIRGPGYRGCNYPYACCLETSLVLSMYRPGFPQQHHPSLLRMQDLQLTDDKLVDSQLLHGVL